MKRTGICPKCGSKDIVQDAMVLDGRHHGVREGEVAVDRNPAALIFKGRQTSTISAWVCGECGFLEHYADYLQDLKV